MPLDITNAANAIGYNFEDFGQCYGLACMGIQACQRNTEAANDFINRVNLIHSYESQRLFKEDFNRALEKYKNLIKVNIDLKNKTIDELFDDNHIDNIEKLLLTMKPFFEGVAMYMGRESIGDVFADAIGYPKVQNYIFPNKILNNALDTKGLNNGHDFTGILNREDISEMLNIESSKKVSYLFSSDDHAFSISCVDNNWITVDHDNITVSKSLTKALSLIKQYSTNNQPVYNVVTFGLKAKEHFLNKLNNNFLERYKKYINESFDQQNNILIECLYLLFAYGPIETLKNLLNILFNEELKDITKIEILLGNNPKNGCSGFYHALQEGNVETVSLFLDLVLNSNLPEETKVKLLKAERVGNVPGFYMVMQHGFSSTVDIFTQKILNSNLSDKSKIELINPVREDRVSGLDIVLKDDHIKTAEIYLKNLLQSKLSKKDKINIINNHAGSNVYGLRSGLVRNKKKFTETYIDIILNSELDSEFKHSYFKVKLISQSQEFLKNISKYNIVNIDIWIKPLFKLLSRYNKDDSEGEQESTVIK